MTETAEVAVVGLGAHGSAAVYQLARRGVRVIGIDRYHPPHTLGSTHGETRITRLAVGEGAAYAPLVLRSHAIWRELEAEGGGALLRQTGGLIMGRRESPVRHHGRDDFVGRSAAVAQRFAIPHEMLAADEIAARYPQFLLRGDEIAYFEPEAGMLAPERCVETQLRLARRHGAILRTGEQVLSVAPHNAGVRLVTDRGTVEAAQCVLTAGPWLAALMPPALRPLLRVHRQVLHWFAPRDPAAYAPDRFPVFIWIHGDQEEDYFYGFPVAEGATDLKMASETYAQASDPDTVDRGVSAGEADALYRRHLAGRLRDVPGHPTRSASCLYTVTPDSGFIIDTLPGQERVLAVSACSGHGFKHSAALGEAVAQRLTEGRSAIDLAAFGWSRFYNASPVPPDAKAGTLD